MSRLLSVLLVLVGFAAVPSTAQIDYCLGVTANSPSYSQHAIALLQAIEATAVQLDRSVTAFLSAAQAVETSERFASRPLVVLGPLYSTSVAQWLSRQEDLCRCLSNLGGSSAHCEVGPIRGRACAPFRRGRGIAIQCLTKGR